MTWHGTSWNRAVGRAALAAMLLACGGCDRPRTRFDVLLISVDTLRADHVSCYGYGKTTTPRLDELAADGVIFTAAQSPRAKTTPAMASVMTGLYPHDHGVRDLTTPLADDRPVLAETLRAAGYRTGAIVGNWVLGRERSGLARGFDVWIEDLPDVRGVPPHDAPQRTARSLTDGALDALGLTSAPTRSSLRGSTGDDDAPWFLWLHYMDPHGAYEPPEEHRVFRSPPEWIAPTSRNLSGARERRVAEYNVPAQARTTSGAFDAAYVRDLYDGEIHYVDAQIGRLLDALRAKGLLETTWVIVTADHGESLGEHAYWFEHGLYAYESTCRVPLIVHPPLALADRPKPGARDGAISLADLAPTLEQWLGLASATPPAGAIRGRSRSSLLYADDGRVHAVYCEKIERAEEARAVQTKAVRAGRWKLIRRFARDEGEPAASELAVLSEELYDLAVDPLEERDLAAAPPGEAPLADLRRALEAFTAADRGLADLGELLQRRREQLERDDPKQARTLESLGY